MMKLTFRNFRVEKGRQGKRERENEGGRGADREKVGRKSQREGKRERGIRGREGGRKLD